MVQPLLHRGTLSVCRRLTAKRNPDLREGAQLPRQIQCMDRHDGAVPRPTCLRGASEPTVCDLSNATDSWVLLFARKHDCCDG